MENKYNLMSHLMIICQ